MLIRLTVLFLLIHCVFGSSFVPAEFPDQSGENADELDYSDSVKDIEKFGKNWKFRIDARNVPCVNTTINFCENVINQDLTNYVESMLAQNDSLKTYFNKTTEKVLSIRTSSHDTTDEMCNSFKRLIHPQLVMNVKRQWHFVVNTPSYQQPIFIESCQTEINNECTCPYPGHHCVQQYTKTQLLGLDENGQFELVFYKYPSNCECKKRKLQTENT